MLAPILFGSGSSGTTTRPSSGTTSGSTSSPPPSETTQPSYQEPEAAAPGDIDDGTYQPAPSEETGEPSPAVDEGRGAPEEVTAETPPAQTEADAEPTPVGEEPDSSETELQAAPDDTSVSNDTAVAGEAVAEDAATGPEETDADAFDPASPANEADTGAEVSPTATTPSPIASDRPVTSAPASERMSAEDAIEAAALAEYRGKRVSPEGAVSDFAQQVTTLIDQSLNRARERALEVSQARIIAGLLSGAETSESPATSALAAGAERQPVDVAEAIRAYRQA
ncbi:MAG: hypothetical protein ACK4HG_11265 [Agrobacterium albertimagni]